MGKSPRKPGSRFRLSWRGLTLQLFVVTILPLTALLLVITFGSLRLHQNAMRSMVGERDERAVRLAARLLETQIAQRVQTLQYLAERASQRSPDELGSLLLPFSDPQTGFDAGLVIFDRDGHLLASGPQAGVFEKSAPVDSQRGFGDPLGIATLWSDAGGGNPPQPYVLVVAQVAGREWTIAGAIWASDLIQRSLEDVAASHHLTTVMVLDETGGMVYQSGPLPEAGGQHPGVAEALRGETGTVYIQAEEGEHVAAYSPIQSPRWALVMEEPWEMVSTPTLNSTQLAPLVLVPVVVLALLALAFGIRQVVQPLRALEAKSAELGWGNYASIQEPVGGIQEIRRLQSELVHLAGKVQAAQQGLRGYIGAMTSAQEDERRRLARELHDDTLQALVALKQRVLLAQMTLDPAAGQTLGEIEALTEQTIQNLRRLTRALRPIYLEDLGLVPALEMLGREAGESMGVPVAVEVRGNPSRLAPDVELALYRMAQEALNNVARHAQASQAQLKLDFSPPGVRLEVRDNGRGFEVPKSPAEFAPSGHFGLLGLHERAELIGAKLQIESAIGEGTRVLVEAARPSGS